LDALILNRKWLFVKIIVFFLQQPSLKKDFMSQFMVEFDLPTPFPPSFVEKIPVQKMVVDEFMEEGKIISYALSMDKGRLWVIVNAQNDFDVLDVINEFPLIDQMQYSMTELMFNHAGAIMVPGFSLN
jgi:hypothetical protein